MKKIENIGFKKWYRSDCNECQPL